MKTHAAIASCMMAVLMALSTAASENDSTGGAPDTREVCPAPPASSDEKPATDPIEEKWGIQILGLRLSAGGYMLDFRYRVVDPEKALPLFDPKVHPVLTHEATGSKFGVPNPPKVGALRTMNEVKKDRNYFIFFANPGQFVKQGDLATITIGECSMEHVRVL